MDTPVPFLLRYSFFFFFFFFNLQAICIAGETDFRKRIHYILFRVAFFAILLATSEAKQSF